MKQKVVVAQIQKLVVKAILLEIFILIALIILATQITGSFKLDMALSITKAYRTPLLSGDSRYVIAGLTNQLGKDFNAVEWKSPNESFVVPQTFKQSYFPVYSKVTVPIYSDEAHKYLIGTLYFFYSRWYFVTWALYSWLFLFLVSLPIVVNERRRLIQNYNLDLKLNSQESFSVFATQVAHDIRSPLAALDSALRDISQLPEERRILVRGAVGRIRDIANNLIEKNKQVASTDKSNAHSDVTSVPASEIATPHLLSSLIEPLISEKRMQFRSRLGVDIEARLEASSYGLFANIQPLEFNRVISNLLNNSVEAFEENGSVVVALAHNGHNVEITVSDNGKGIQPGILTKLGTKRGETHGKEGGSGLGLYHARTSVESWGGALDIVSEPAKGTTVTLTLPSVAAPEWFVPELKLDPDSRVVILDDDTSIHRVWQERFDSARVRDQKINIFHFSAPDEFRAWVQANYSSEQPTVFLMDYEFLGYKETGVSLLEDLGISEQAILITSHYEEKQILGDCKRLKVRMIPKGLAGLVPISIATPELLAQKTMVTRPTNKTAVLLDDDALVHMTWKLAAKSAGVVLKPFKNSADFFAISETLSKDTPIYIDSDLGSGLKGEEIAKVIHEKGFQNIILETGHLSGSFPSMPWIKAVISKEPPWPSK